MDGVDGKEAFACMHASDFLGPFDHIQREVKKRCRCLGVGRADRLIMLQAINVSPSPSDAWNAAGESNCECTLLHC
jgi:hypothetical protein